MLVGGLLGPTGPEPTCERCFEELDRYVEPELAGADADAGIPGMRAHLGDARPAAEDHESLRSFLTT